MSPAPAQGWVDGYFLRWITKSNEMDVTSCGNKELHPLEMLAYCCQNMIDDARIMYVNVFSPNFSTDSNSHL